MIGGHLVKIYLKVHQDVVQEIERTTGAKPEPYKDLEENILLAYFNTFESKKELNGLDFTADILSSLILDQALPNANHRTAMYFVGTLLTHNDITLNMESNAILVREYFLNSKHILKKAPKGYREKHLALSKTFLENLLGSIQSGRLGRILAYSLMNSFIDSSKDLDLF